MTKQVQNNINILFVCHGNMLQGISIGLNLYERKNVKETLKNHDWQTSWNCFIIKVQKRQFTPVSGFQVYNLIKNSHGLVGGWLFFCTYNHNNKYSKRNHQRKCLICTHVIPPPFGDGSHPAVGTAYTHYTKGWTACKGYKWKTALVYWTNL